MKRALVLLVILGCCCWAHGGDLVHDFYKRKGKTTTRQAFERAAVRLENARVGMTQSQFFEVMAMEVLAHDGKMEDVLLDGYLWQSSMAMTAEGREKNLIFGYVEKSREVPQVLVVFRDNRVAKIERLERPAQAGRN